MYIANPLILEGEFPWRLAMGIFISPEVLQTCSLVL